MTLSLKVLSAPKALKAAAAAGAAPGAAPAPAAPPVKRVIHVAYPTGLPAGYLDAQVGHLIIWPPVCLSKCLTHSRALSPTPVPKSL